MKNKSYKEQIGRRSDALFGPPENMDLAEAVENLKAAGVEPEELCKRMYEKLCIAAQAYRVRNEPVPPRLRKALEDLRPNTLPARNQEELERTANSTISRVLDAVKAPFTLTPHFAGLTLNQSFRHKTSEQPIEDQRIINRLEKELLKDLEKEEKENQD